MTDDETGFDGYADAYGEAVQQSISFSGANHDFFTRRKVEYLLDLASRWLGPPESLSALDFGCGIGLTDAHLAGRFGALAGVDTGTEVIRRAAAANPSVSYLAYDGERLPYADERFDLAFAICVLHHVPPERRPGLVSELRRVVRPGGLVAIFEHNPLNPLTRLAVFRCAFDGDAVLATAGSIDRLLRVAALRPVERRYVILLPSDRRRVRTLERALGRLPLAAQYYVAAQR